MKKLKMLMRRFRQNGRIEKKNSALLERRGNPVLAHTHMIRSEIWFCAANVIEDEIKST